MQLYIQIESKNSEFTWDDIAYHTKYKPYYSVLSTFWNINLFPNKVFLSMHIILCTRDIAQGWVLSNIWKHHLSDNVKFLHLFYIKAYLISSTIYYTLCNRCRKQGLFLIDRFVSDDPISMRHHKHKICILMGKIETILLNA